MMNRLTAELYRFRRLTYPVDGLHARHLRQSPQPFWSHATKLYEGAYFTKRIFKKEVILRKVGAGVVHHRQTAYNEAR